MQYSYLPSWISFLVDQEKAREAGRELFDAVYDRWSKPAPGRAAEAVRVRPEPGVLRGETAFSGEYDLRNRTAGALFAGPPNFNTLYREFTDDRDAGSLEVEPVYKGGRAVRFTNDVAAGVEPAAAPGRGPGSCISSTPRTRSSGGSRPWSGTGRTGWASRGRDVLDAMVWIPVVTFWQVTVDLPLATGVPDGHGHTYTREFVDGWAKILQPPGLTPDKAEQLRDIVTPEPG